MYLGVCDSRYNSLKDTPSRVPSRRPHPPRPYDPRSHIHTGPQDHTLPVPTFLVHTYTQVHWVSQHFVMFFKLVVEFRAHVFWTFQIKELCDDCDMIFQRGSSWCTWSETFHSQISHPHDGSTWPVVKKEIFISKTGNKNLSLKISLFLRDFYFQFSSSRWSYLFRPTFVRQMRTKGFHSVRVSWTSFVKFQILSTIN